MYTFFVVITIMYEYMTLSDETGTAHSEIKPDEAEHTFLFLFDPDIV